MTITPHLLTGAALASYAPNYPLAIIMGLLSHFVLDAIPHLDPGTLHNNRPSGYPGKIDLARVHENDAPWPAWIYIWIAVEMIFAWGLLILLTYHKSDFGLALVGGFAAIFVDILDNPIFYFCHNWPVIKQIHYLHHRLHYDLPKNKWYWGALTELIILGGTSWFLLKKF